MPRLISHLKAIDGLRAWMAWWVVVQHILVLGGVQGTLPSLVYAFLASGGIAVDVFIIVSGYVICHLVLTERERYGPYILRRFLRIFPLYLFALGVSFLLRDIYVSVFSLHPWMDGIAERTARFEAENENLPLHLVLHATLLHGIFPDNVISYASSAFLAPAWSLSLEWQFYLLAPLLLLIWQRNKPIWALAVAAASLLLSCYAQLGPWVWRFPANLFLSLGFFFLGIATRYALQYGVKSLLLPAILIVANFALSVYRLGLHYLFFELLIALVVWLMAMLAVRVELGGDTSRPWLAKVYVSLFSGRRIVEIGKWSYSTYLLHIPFFTLVLFLINKLGFGEGRYSYAIAMLLSMPFLLWVSKLSYTWIEKPALLLAKRLTASSGQKFAADGR